MRRRGWDQANVPVYTGLGPPSELGASPRGTKIRLLVETDYLDRRQQLFKVLCLLSHLKKIS